MILKSFPGKFIKIIKTDFVKGEMLKTHGSNKFLKIILEDWFLQILKVGLNTTINSFKKNDC